MELLKVLMERWSAESPEFFQGVKKTAIVLVAISAVLIGANESAALGIPENIIGLLKYVISTGTSMGFTAQLTKK
jgi:hypothetical protein